MIKRILFYCQQYPSIFFTVLAFWLSLEYIILGPYSYLRIGDNFDVFIPRLTTLWNGFITSGSAHWSAVFTGGIDRLANDMVYPNVAGVVFAMLPAWLAVGVVISGTLFLGGWYTYRVCHEHLGRSKSGSMLAGMFFAFALVRIDIIPFLLGLSILPVALYYLELIAAKEKGMPRYGGAVLLGFVFAVFSSVPFTLPFTLSAAALWFVVVRKYYTRSSIALFLLFALATTLPHLPVVRSLMVNAPLSNRAGDFYQAGLAHAHAMVRYFVELYWLQGVLVVFGFLFLPIKERAYRAAVLFAFVFLVIGVWYQPFATRFGHYFLTVKDFGFDRFYLLIPFFLALGIAFTFDAIPRVMVMRKRSYAVRTIFLMVTTALIFGMSGNLKAAHLRAWFRNGSFYANISSPDFVSIASTSTPFRAAVIADERTGFLPAFANMNGFETIDGDTNIISKRYGEFFKEMTHHWRVDPKHSFYFMWQATPEERKRFGIDANEFLNPALFSLANVRYIFSPFPMTLPGFKLVSEPLPEEGVVESIRVKIKENFHGKRLAVYENESVFPRVFLASTIQIFSDEASLLGALGKATTSTLRSTVFAEVNDANPLSVLGVTMQKAAITAYGADKITVATESDGPSVLVLTNNYNPGWRVSVDGARKKVMPVDHTFMGVILERGNHEVVWEYK